MNLNQPVVITKDKRDPEDREGRNIETLTARYEGYFPWAVMFNNGKRWLPGIFDYEEYISGEMVTLDERQMRHLYPTIIRVEGAPFALPVYRNRFVIGTHFIIKVWEHEIEYQIIN